MKGIWSTLLCVCLSVPVAAESADLTKAEMQLFRSEVQACWLVDTDLPTVTVGFQLDQSGKPKAETLRVVAHEKADRALSDKAFASAKRAILRCGRDGYTLPVEKYDKWRDIELTFTPERTSLK